MFFLKKIHSTLGSVVPLALFAEVKCQEEPQTYIGPILLGGSRAARKVKSWMRALLGFRATDDK